VNVHDVEFHDDEEKNRCESTFSFAAQSIGQFVTGGRLILKPDLLPSRMLPAFAETDRKHAVKLRSLHHTSEVSLELPENFVVEQMPREMKIESAYGVYTRSYVRTGKAIVLKTNLELRNGVVPVAEFSNFRTFVRQTTAAAQQALLINAKLP
jgi:hypothetical protein